jgi:hypothetical protein
MEDQTIGSDHKPRKAYSCLWRSKPGLTWAPYLFCGVLYTVVLRLMRVLGDTIGFQFIHDGEAIVIVLLATAYKAPNCRSSCWGCHCHPCMYFMLSFDKLKVCGS